MMKQNYNAYSEDDHRVWQLLFDRQFANLQDKACAPYLNCLSSIQDALNHRRIPQFQQLDSILIEQTGWSIEVVPGHIPVNDFFSLLAQKKFPSSTWLRSLEQLDYLEEPDMFHDIFGHIPLLLDKRYARFMHLIGLLGVKWRRNTKAVSALRSLYWFTIEFGLVFEDGHRCIYGAGILSSYGESTQVMSRQIECRSFVIAEILSTEFRIDAMQNTYFAAGSFDEFLNCIHDIEKLLPENSTVAAVNR
jgi:phenylalanine-4-hydroxylase